MSWAGFFIYIPCIPRRDSKKRKMSNSSSVFDSVDYGFFDDAFDDFDEHEFGTSLGVVAVQSQNDISFGPSFSPAEIIGSSLNYPPVQLEDNHAEFDANCHQEKWFKRKLSDVEKCCPKCNHGKTVLMEMHNPSVAIRSFSVSPKEMAIAVSAFRVTSGPYYPNTVEFRFSAATVKKTYNAWRTHDDFLALARENSVFQRADMRGTRAKFDSLLLHRQRSLNNFDVPRLIEHFHQLSDFLEDFFFAIDDKSPKTILEFANNAKWMGSWTRPTKRTCSACDS